MPSIPLSAQNMRSCPGNLSEMVWGGSQGDDHKQAPGQQVVHSLRVPHCVRRRQALDAHHARGLALRKVGTTASAFVYGSVNWLVGWLIHLLSWHMLESSF